MRMLTCLIAGMAFCGNAMALETAAGADTVNSSQVGINAKIESSNAITSSAISRITNCGKDGKTYDAVHNVCVGETDPVATPGVNKIFACGNGNKIAHSDGTCSGSIPPDLTNSLKTTNGNVSTLQGQVIAIVNCGAQGKLFNGIACASVAPHTWSFNYYDIKNGNASAVEIGWHNWCASAGINGGSTAAGLLQVWYDGGPNTAGQYHFLGRANPDQNHNSRDFYIICGD
jgi:hypothetical protein